MYSKYNAKKCRCSQGHIHDSVKEAKRCNELTFLEKAGDITNLRQQVKYTLIPAQYAESTEKYTKGKHKGEYKRGRILRR